MKNLSIFEPQIEKTMFIKKHVCYQSMGQVKKEFQSSIKHLKHLMVKC